MRYGLRHVDGTLILHVAFKGLLGLGQVHEMGYVGGRGGVRITTCAAFNWEIVCGPI